MAKYDLLIERIVRTTGKTKEEIEEKVEAKKEKLSGLISKEGAAQIIAAELGINFEDQDLKIEELLPGMRKVNVIGKVMTRKERKERKSSKLYDSRRNWGNKSGTMGHKPYRTYRK
jgi:ssDNA-binding replication factor A large subunit